MRGHLSIFDRRLEVEVNDVVAVVRHVRAAVFVFPELGFAAGNLRARQCRCLDVYSETLPLAGFRLQHSAFRKYDTLSPDSLIDLVLRSMEFAPQHPSHLWKLLQPLEVVLPAKLHDFHWHRICGRHTISISLCTQPIRGQLCIDQVDSSH